MKKINNVNIGIDVTNIDSFINKDQYFIKRILTKNEYIEYEQSLNKEKYLASRWALKEATFKATPECSKIFFKFEFLKNNNGSISCTNNDNIKVSLSYCDNKVYAIALYIE